VTFSEDFEETMSAHCPLSLPPGIDCPFDVEAIAKQGIQPPANISFNTKPAERRIDGASFAKFASDGSTSVTSNTSGDDTLETKSMTVEPAAQAVASCGVKASLPFSVLIVEDTDICARLLAMQLKKLKCSTQRAENGQVSIDLLMGPLPGTFDLVLMDLRMPVMDGLEATKLIQKELNLTLPIVALTGELSQDIKSECEGIGFDDFYSKPLKKDKCKRLLVLTRIDSLEESNEGKYPETYDALCVSKI